MYTLLFTPRSFLQLDNKQIYGIGGYITIDLIEPNKDLDNCIFASEQHYDLYETLKEYGSWELHNTEG